MPNIWTWDYPEPLPFYFWIQGKDENSLILEIAGWGS